MSTTPFVKALIRWATGKRLTDRLPKLSLISLTRSLRRWEYPKVDLTAVVFYYIYKCTASSSTVCTSLINSTIYNIITAQLSVPPCLFKQRWPFNRMTECLDNVLSVASHRDKGREMERVSPRGHIHTNSETTKRDATTPHFQSTRKRHFGETIAIPSVALHDAVANV